MIKSNSDMNFHMSKSHSRTTRVINTLPLTFIALLGMLLHSSSSFQITPSPRLSSTSTLTSTSTSTSSTTSLLYSSSSDEESPTNISTNTKQFQNNGRWSSLSPSVKARIITEAQNRAIRNKKKREPIADKKRRLMMRYKEAQRSAKRASRITRPLPTASPDRIDLSDVVVLDEVYNGTVISLTDFGAYVDIGSGCDGLLHVSQITREEFVEHPRQVLVPGMQVDVRVLRVSPELRKMQLTMLPQEVLSNERNIVKGEGGEENGGGSERIPLEDMAVDDELWGEIRRVTAFGAYVEIGAVVDGWLHFMDHPLFGNVPGARPREFMEVGQRIRCWVSGVDPDMNRIKLTANRPENLPGPRREIRKTTLEDDADYY